MNNISDVKIKKNIKKNKNIKKKYKGGFCKDKSCKKIIVKIDPSKIINVVLKGIFYPINFITRAILKTIKFTIEYWNDLIIRLSYVFEDLLLTLTYTFNGYIDVFNIIIGELKTIMTIALTLLTNNPFSLLSIWVTPLAQELIDFTMDAATFEMITRIFFIDFSSFRAFLNSINIFRPLIEFLKATFYLIIGKTIKPNCNVNLYGSNQQKENNCHEFNVPKCRLNIRTIYNIVFYVLIILYFAGWLSFFKIFYKTESTVNIVSYLRNKYKIVSNKID